MKAPGVYMKISILSLFVRFENTIKYHSKLDLFQSLLRFLDSNSRKRWTLCYRASSHGWAASTFHSRCDGKPHTVTIIRKSPYVFGGYTDIAWGENIGLFRE